MSWPLVACLVAGAIAAGWPSATARNRLAGRRPPRYAAMGSALVAFAVQRPGRVAGAAVIVVAAGGLTVGGPVAAWIGAVYAGLTGRAVIRRVVRRHAASSRTASLDELAALAADLRAGQVAPAASPARVDSRIAALTAAVWRLAERTGAPAADLVERIEADARAAGRAEVAAAAQAAGAQATAVLLAALPLCGIGLGAAMGADPVRVLLRTPIGGACAVLATLLQAAGLLWTDRLIRGATR